MSNLLGLMKQQPKDNKQKPSSNLLFNLPFIGQPKPTDISYLTAESTRPTILGSPEAKKLKQSYEQVQKQKTQYVTKELPKQVNKAAQQNKQAVGTAQSEVNKFYDDLLQNPDYAGRENEINQVRKQVLGQLKTDIPGQLNDDLYQQAQKAQNNALTGADKVNKFGVKKAEVDIKQSTKQPLTQEERFTRAAAPLESKVALGALGKLNQMGQDFMNLTGAIGAPISRAAENIPLFRNIKQAEINRINQRLNQDISANERVELLKRKSFIETDTDTALKASNQPNVIEQLQNRALGQDVAEGYRQTGGYKAGEIAGEILPLAFAPETGAGKFVAEKVAQTGVGKAAARILGKEGLEVLAKGAVENAIQEIPLGAIQEGSKAVTGEQTAGQALQNLATRTALAGGLGGVAEAGAGVLLPAAIKKGGQVLEDTFEPLARARKFDEVKTQRAQVQADRVQRDLDTEEVRNALRAQEQKAILEQVTPNYQTKIAQRTQKAASKDINETIQEAQTRLATQAKEEEALQKALQKLEQKSVKQENLQFKQEQKIGKQAVKEVNQTIQNAQKQLTAEQIAAQQKKVLEIKNEISTIKNAQKRGIPGERYSTRNLQRLEQELSQFQAPPRLRAGSSTPQRAQILNTEAQPNALTRQEPVLNQVETRASQQLQQTNQLDPRTIEELPTQRTSLESNTQLKDTNLKQNVPEVGIPISKTNSRVQPKAPVIKTAKELEVLTDADKVKAQRKFTEEVNEWEKIKDPVQKQDRRAELLKEYPPEIWKQVGKEVESIRRKVKSSVTTSRLIIQDGEVVGRMRPNYRQNGNLRNIDSWNIEDINGNTIATLSKEKKYIETSDLKDLLIADADKFPRSGILYDPKTKKYFKDGRSTTRGELSHFETLGFLKKQEAPNVKDSSTVQTPRNQAELENTYKQVFKLEEPKAKAAAGDDASEALNRLTPEQKAAQREVKAAFREAIDNGSEFSQLPVKEALMRAGIDDNSIKGILGKTDEKLSINQLPPEAKERVVNFLAAKDARGELSADIKRSILENSDGKNLARSANANALDEINTQRFIDEAGDLEGQAIEEQAVRELRRATTPEQLDEIVERNSDAFSYSEDGTPSNFARAYEQRYEQLTGNSARKFPKTVKKNPVLAQEIKDGTGELRYERLSNKKIVEQGKKLVENDGLDETFNALMRKEAKDFDAQDIATSREVIARFQENGDYDKAIDLIERLAGEGTSAGQKIQAYKLFGSLDPEGAILTAQRRVEAKLNPKQKDILQKQANEIIEETKTLKRKANKKFFKELDDFCGFGEGEA